MRRILCPAFWLWVTANTLLRAQQSRQEPVTDEIDTRNDAGNSSSGNLLDEVSAIFWSRITIRPEFYRSSNLSVLDHEEGNNPRGLDSVGYGHITNRLMLVAY